MIRAYTRTVGIALICFSVLGLAEVVNTSLGGDFYHLVLGTLFLIAGFGFRVAQEQDIRVMVGGLGAFTLLAKAPLIWYAHSHALDHRPVEFVCVVVGVLSILAALFLPDGRAR